MKQFSSSLLAIMLLTLVGACSDSDTPAELPVCPNPALDHIALDTPEDTVTIEISPVITKQIIGAGYDVCAPYLSHKAVKAPVVDIEKMEALGDDYYIIMQGTSSYSDENTFITADQMPSTLQANISNDSWFSSDIAHSSCFSFTYINTNIRLYIHRLLLMNHLINNHPEQVLCDEFLSDIKTMKPQDIISKYGTHVITAASTGIHISGLYRTAAFPPLHIGGDHGPSADMVCQYSAIGAMQKTQLPLYIGVSGDRSPLNTMRSDGALRITLEGGNTSLLSAHPTTDEFNAWLNEQCTTENGALLDFPDDPKPIYEFISDQDKALAVKRASDQYIQANKLRMEQTAVLLQSYEGGQYKYSTTPTSDTQGGVCAVYLTQNSGHIPLYSVTEGKTSRLMTGQNGAPQPDTSLFIGYIYSSQVKGTVPLYEFQCDGFYYYTLKDGGTSTAEHRWSKTGILGYVIPLTVE